MNTDKHGKEYLWQGLVVDRFITGRHPDENRGPGILRVLKEPGFRLPPE
jgi:hypothetical protein